uniref:Uncharacterized protein n=1 Tax=Arundo donax TaxID=35708 RepID=A0A0A9B405_ARUDO
MSQQVVVPEACSRKLCVRRCLRWECGVAAVAKEYRLSGRKERMNLHVITRLIDVNCR